MFIFFSFKTNMIKEAYMGMQKCANCSAMTHFHMVRIVDRLAVFFIPIFQRKKSPAIVCDRCQIGFSITEEERQVCLTQEGSRLTMSQMNEMVRYLKTHSLYVQGPNRTDILLSRVRDQFAISGHDAEIIRLIKLLEEEEQETDRFGSFMND